MPTNSLVALLLAAPFAAQSASARAVPPAFELVETSLADLCALARAHLSDPYLTLHAAERYGHHEQAWPKPYLAVKPKAPGPSA